MVTIQNTSKGFFAKLFGRDHLVSLSLVDDGLTATLSKTGQVHIPFTDIRDVRTMHYFDKQTPYRSVSITTTALKTYEIEIDPYSGETETLLKHYAKYQLGREDLPENPNDLHLVLETYNQSQVVLKDGELIFSNKGKERRYAMSELNYYKIEPGTNRISFKFPEKKLYETISINSANNLWLITEVLSTYYKKGKLLQ